MSYKEMFSALKARSNFVGATLRDLSRLAFYGVFILVCFYPDFEALRTAKFILGVFLVVALIAHVTRKYALFPYLNMGNYARKAFEHPLGAAIVFLSVTNVVVVSIYTASTFFAK